MILQPKGFSSLTTSIMLLISYFLFIILIHIINYTVQGPCPYFSEHYGLAGCLHLILKLNISTEKGTRMLGWTCDPANLLKKSWHNPVFTNFISAYNLFRKTLLSDNTNSIFAGVINGGCQPTYTYLTIESLPSEEIL